MYVKPTGTYVLFLVLAILAPIMACQQRANDTKVSEDAFRLTLPGSWKSGDRSDPTRRTYLTRNEQLTVSMFGSAFVGSDSLSHDERASRFKVWVNKRRDLETKMPGYANVVVSEPIFGESNATLVSRYTGFDAARHRRFHCLILASISAFEIFYYEAVEMSDAVAEERAKTIFNSVAIAK